MVFSNHLDVGFAAHVEGQPADLGTDATVLDNYFGTYFPRALATAEALRADGESFIWTTQSWLVAMYRDCPTGLGLRKCPNASQVAAFDDALRRGDVAYHAFPHNAQPELMDAGMFLAGVQLTHTLDDALGVPRRAVMSQRDVPGLSRAAVPLLRRAGVQAVSVGVNGGSAPPGVPHNTAFLWRDEASGEQMYAMWHPGGYGGQQTGGLYPYVSYAGDCVVTPGWETALCFAWRGDNAGPAEPEEVKADFATLRSEFPGADVFASTFDAFVAELAVAPLDLPVVTEEVGDSWIMGVQSDAHKTMEYRALQRARARCLADAGTAAGCAAAQDAARLANFTRFLVKVPEHTWGLDCKHAPNDWRAWSNADLSAARESEPLFWAAEHGWRLQRAYIRYAIDALDAADPLLALVSEELAALAPAKEEPPPGQAPDGFVKLADPSAGVTFAGGNESGAMIVAFSSNGLALGRFAAGGVEWAAESRPLLDFAYSTYTADDYSIVRTRYWFDPIQGSDPNGWMHKDYRKPNVSAGNPVHSTVRPTLEGVYAKYAASGYAQALLATARMPKDAVHFAGAPERLSILLEPQADGGDLQATLTWRRKTPTRLPEAAWLRVLGPPDASWTVEKMGSSVSPYQVLRNSSVMHAVGDAGATLEDKKSGALLSVGSLDAALLSVGAPDPFYATTKDGSPPATATHGSSFCLANNIWGTNYVMWQPYDAKDSDAAFRFTLRAVAAQA